MGMALAVAVVEHCVMVTGVFVEQSVMATGVAMGGSSFEGLSSGVPVPRVVVVVTGVLVAGVVMMCGSSFEGLSGGVLVPVGWMRASPSGGLLGDSIGGLSDMGTPVKAVAIPVNWMRVSGGL